MIDTGKPPVKLPIMGYKELDLFNLYREVVAHGGFKEVIKNVGTWSKIWKKLSNYDPSITDSSFRLKRNYERYLLEYEFHNFPENKKRVLHHDKYARKKHLIPQEMNGTEIASTEANVSCIKDVPRHPDGSIIFPLVLGEITIESLGQIYPRQPYVTDKHVWPIGFVSSRYFSSTKNPSIRVKYTCKIEDTGDRPRFIVTPEDDTTHPIISHSPSGAWRIVLSRINSFQDPISFPGGHEAHKAIAVSGRVRFGLAHPTVTALIRQLPGGEYCKPKALTCVGGGKRKRDAINGTCLDTTTKIAKTINVTDTSDYLPLQPSANSTTQSTVVQQPKVSSISQLLNSESNCSPCIFPTNSYTQPFSLPLPSRCPYPFEFPVSPSSSCSSISSPLPSSSEDYPGISAYKQELLASEDDAIFALLQFRSIDNKKI